MCYIHDSQQNFIMAEEEIQKYTEETRNLKIALPYKTEYKITSILNYWNIYKLPYYPSYKPQNYIRLEPPQIKIV